MTTEYGRAKMQNIFAGRSLPIVSWRKSQGD
jgi:hypothetical protein